MTAKEATHLNIVQACWWMQSQGMSYPEIALTIWPRCMILWKAQAYTSLFNEYRSLKTKDAQQKFVCRALKGYVDNLILNLGRFGPKFCEDYLNNPRKYPQSVCVQLRKELNGIEGPYEVALKILADRHFNREAVNV